MKRWKKRGLIGVGLLIVLTLIGVAVFRNLQVELVTAQRAKVASTVMTKGTVVCTDSQDIYAQTQGKIARLYVEPGDQVNKGKLLAEIDSADLNSEIAQLEGQLKAIQGSALAQRGNNQLKNLQLALEQAQTGLKLSQAAYDRTKQLYDAEAVSTVEMEKAQADLENSQKLVAQAEAALAVQSQQNQGTQIQYQGQAEQIQARLNYLNSQLKNTKLVAGTEGTVLTKTIQEGEMVSPGRLLFTLGQRDQLEVKTYVNTQDVAGLQVNQGVKVTVKEPEKDVKIKGQITKVAPAAEERTSALGLQEDQVQVTVKLDDTPPALIPGASVDVEFTTAEVDQVLAVPKEALFDNAGKNYLWVVEDGKAHLQQVEEGMEGDNLVEIKNGLKVGARIVLNPHLAGLKEGVKIKE